MEIDTGAALSIISEETRKMIFPDEPLHDSLIILKTYTSVRIQVTGQLNLHVYDGQVQYLHCKKWGVVVHLYTRHECQDPHLVAQYAPMGAQCYTPLFHYTPWRATLHPTESCTLGA